MTLSLVNEPEYIKAELRKRYGSLLRFERLRGLGRRSVTDVLLGRRSRPTAEIIAAELGHTAASLFPSLYGTSADADLADSAEIGATHRLNSRGQ